MQIAVSNVLPQRLVWGHLRDVMEGVERYCPNQECAFEFLVGEGPVLGRGRLARV